MPVRGANCSLTCRSVATSLNDHSPTASGIYPRNEETRQHTQISKDLHHTKLKKKPHDNFKCNKTVDKIHDPFLLKNRCVQKEHSLTEQNKDTTTSRPAS